MVTLGALIEEQRGKDPSLAKICYFAVSDKVMPGNPGAFDLTRKLHVVFRPVTVRATELEAAGGLKLLQSNIAGAVPSALWQQLQRHPACGAPGGPCSPGDAASRPVLHPQWLMQCWSGGSVF